MKQKIAILLAVLVLFIGAYLGRHWLKDQWELFTKPELPKPTAFTDQEQPAADDSINADLPSGPPSHIEGGISESENFKLESSPQTTEPPEIDKPVDPLAGDVDIPEELNLDVPWMSQAPNANWDYPYQEACEEASMIMVDEFYKMNSGKIPVDEADKKILDLVKYQEDELGYYRDTTAEETAQILRDYFNYRDVRVLPLTSALDIQAVLARGYPVIIPFWGKAIGNPNYRNGGPLYHMMVMKGYTKDDQFITGDPGTRKGQDYVYAFDRIMEAAHDWNDGDVQNGKKVMIIVLPNQIP
ncbi:MAG: C39 family peptidase [Patescibacteria group bacterium]